MKRMKIWAIIMVAIMALSGCGETKETNIDNTETKETSISEEVKTEETETVSSNTVEAEAPSEEENSIDSKIVEKEDSELNLKSYYYSMEDRTLCEQGEDVFGTVVFDETESTNYVTKGEVPIYAQNGVKIGYTKENVDIIVMGTYGDWCRFYLDTDQRYARISDIEANAITMDERDAVVMAEEEKRQQEATAKAETPVENVPSEQPVVNTPTETEPIEQPTESNKYTPEEAVAVYRAGMEAGGITWNPALKDGGSWGTGWLYLDKGEPERAAQSSLEAFAIGNGGGDSWTEYYLEVTGSDEECVYYTKWRP